MKFEPVKLHLQEGDIITSKKGLMMISPISGLTYLVTKIKYLGGDSYTVMSGKVPLDIKPIVRT